MSAALRELVRRFVSLSDHANIVVFFVICCLQRRRVCLGRVVWCGAECICRGDSHCNGVGQSFQGFRQRSVEVAAPPGIMFPTVCRFGLGWAASAGQPGEVTLGGSRGPGPVAGGPPSFACTEAERTYHHCPARYTTFIQRARARQGLPSHFLCLWAPGSNCSPDTDVLENQDSPLLYFSAPSIALAGRSESLHVLTELEIKHYISALEK